MDTHNEAGKPEIWALPSTGMTWCECGEGHELTREDVFLRAEALGLTPGQPVAHAELVQLVMDLWNYVAVCRFFHMALERAVKTVSGSTAPSYPYPVAIDIAGYFSKTWQGCPEVDCELD